MTLLQFVGLAFAFYIIAALIYAYIQRSRQRDLVEIRRVTATASGTTSTYSEGGGGAFSASQHLGSKCFLPGSHEETVWRAEMSVLREEHPGSHTSMDRVDFTVESQYVSEEEAASLLGKKRAVQI